MREWLRMKCDVCHRAYYCFAVSAQNAPPGVYAHRPRVAWYAWPSESPPNFQPAGGWLCRASIVAVGRESCDGAALWKLVLIVRPCSSIIRSAPFAQVTAAARVELLLNVGETPAVGWNAAAAVRRWCGSSRVAAAARWRKSCESGKDEFAACAILSAMGATLPAVMLPASCQCLLAVCIKRPDAAAARCRKSSERG